MTIRQPNVSLVKAVSQSLVGAGDVISYTLVIKNIGNDIAHTFGFTDKLPAGLSLLGVDTVEIAYPPGFPDLSEPSRIHVTPASVPGATLAYAIDRMYVGATVKIVYRAQVAADIASDMVLTNTANIPYYYSKPATTPDTNGDGLPDLRVYTGPTATAVVRTPEGSIRKMVLADELTYGSTLVYTITVPAQPINATMYNVVVTDTIDSALDVVDWTAAVVNPNQVIADLGTIAPNEQRTVVVTVQLPVDSTVMPGATVANRAWVKYGGGVKESNEVVNTIVAPALLIEKEAAQVEVKVGDLLEYTITVRNAGNGRAENLRLADALPAVMNVEPGTTLLNGVAYADPAGSAWQLPNLVGGGVHTLSFKARVNQADPGVLYTNTATVVGTDSRGQPIPADNSVRIPADVDPDDSADAWVFGPLTWTQESTYVAYEDLKNTGWSDWDYNDFIVKIDVAKGATPAGELAVLRLGYEAMAHGGAFDHQFLHKLPVFGNGRYTLKINNGAGSLVSRTAGVTGDEPTIEIFKRTKVALPLPTNVPYDLNKYPFSNTMQQQPGAVKGYQATLQVVLGQPGANPLDVLPPLPWDPYLYVYPTLQQVHLVQPGHLDNTQVVNNAFDPGNPMLGFDLPLANVFNSEWYWPQEFLGIWRVYADYVNYSITDGSQSTDWWSPTNPNTNLQYAWHATAGAMDAMGVTWGDGVSSRYYATPLVTDLENDGSPEVIVGNLIQWRLEVVGADGKARQGWPQTLMGEVKAGATAADLDGDGVQEILVGDMKGNLYAFHANGTPVAGWPIKAGSGTKAVFRVLSKPAVANITGDGAPEVIVALSDGKLYAYTAAGALLTGWPVTLGDVADLYGSHQVDSSPTVADLDGDGMVEIVVGSYDKQLYAYHANGARAWVFATGDAILGTPAIADIDSATPGLETVIGSGDRFVYVLDKDGHQLWKRPTGWIVRSSPLVADIDNDGSLEIVIGSDDHKVYAWHHDGSRVANWPVATGAAVEAAPVFADVDGDGVSEIVVSSDDTNVYAWRSDGSLVAGWPQALVSPAKGGPAVGNLDGDAAMEIVVATSGGVLQPYGALWTPWGSAPVFLPIIGK
ncbi:MAG: DUF11 domain-containing protein [Anaerolineales bacterium]|nr:DUF11 domain-containing protein [Anaerolineales bacterium]